MSLITIDEAKCVRDNLCAMDCPVALIRRSPGSRIPHEVEGAEAQCIACGHCIAVCPHGALTNSRVDMSNCPELDPSRQPSTAQVEHLFRARRSIRSFRPRPVGREELTRLIRLAGYAPTGGNSQQVGWTIYPSAARVRELAGRVVDFMRHMAGSPSPASKRYNWGHIVRAWEAGIDIVGRSAPALVAVHAPRDYNSGPVDCAIALTHFDLAASSLGLGTCWGGFFMMAIPHWPPLQEALELPDGEACGGVMMAGYPALSYHRLPARREPRIAWKE